MIIVAKFSKRKVALYFASLTAVFAILLFLVLISIHRTNIALNIRAIILIIGLLVFFIIESRDIIFAIIAGVKNSGVAIRIEDGDLIYIDRRLYRWPIRDILSVSSSKDMLGSFVRHRTCVTLKNGQVNLINNWLISEPSSLIVSKIRKNLHQ
jgi:hypothetical protein